jgi:hypothetical protein
LPAKTFLASPSKILHSNRLKKCFFKQEKSSQNFLVHLPKSLFFTPLTSEILEKIRKDSGFSKRRNKSKIFEH